MRCSSIWCRHWAQTRRKTVQTALRISGRENWHVHFVAVHNLSQVEVQQGFPILLLRLISDDAVDQTLRIAGAVYFKNYVKRHWVNVSLALSSPSVRLHVELTQHFFHVGQWRGSRQNCTSRPSGDQEPDCAAHDHRARQAAAADQRCAQPDCRIWLPCALGVFAART